MVLTVNTDLEVEDSRGRVLDSSSASICTTTALLEFYSENSESKYTNVVVPLKLCFVLL